MSHREYHLDIVLLTTRFGVQIFAACDRKGAYDCFFPGILSRMEKSSSGTGSANGE